MEYNLAKVGVAGSNPVSRSAKPECVCIPVFRISECVNFYGQREVSYVKAVAVFSVSGSKWEFFGGCGGEFYFAVGDLYRPAWCPERGMLLDTRPQRLFCLWRFSHSVRRSFREVNRHYRIYPGKPPDVSDSAEGRRVYGLLFPGEISEGSWNLGIKIGR